ncbi:16S rRNA (cytidine(1402)-2'-O)-methyltransferase [uncultured Boseongicola sp.]|jgi:16S rRNA (cytidine1402-2'-O)-methyltransferase|uniref:16S rRNA (cytidine(1402)-2'-O)-methyltransferase n=1 Tax=uncultured Boseongicola sp. TaxID=1648499 RepID=UPI002630AC4A|nr:16S rRNA (cytidine(1402)-2'-O)-methyltransferase [uncultured Boseongicola sp.]
MVSEASQVPLAAGLYFVATPIGNARDITLRALDILRAADVLVAEDTRTLRRLMEIHGVPLDGRRVLAYHDHNGAAMRPRLLDAVRTGKSVAYASDAGTPLVADPGYSLGRAMTGEGLVITSAPGPSAVLAALTLSGLPSDCFIFAGFSPTAKSARKSFLESFRDVAGTLVLFESPRRLSAMLAAAVEVLGPERDAAVCRELTKRFEEVRRGTLADLAEQYDGIVPKGEIVLCIAKGATEVDPARVRDAMTEAMKTQKLKAAATDVADRFGVSKRDLYQLGLEIQSED